jgi:hypothetical protein
LPEQTGTAGEPSPIRIFCKKKQIGLFRAALRPPITICTAVDTSPYRVYRRTGKTSFVFKKKARGAGMIKYVPNFGEMLLYISNVNNLL